VVSYTNTVFHEINTLTAVQPINERPYRLPDLSDIPENRLNRYQKVTQLAQILWK